VKKVTIIKDKFCEFIYDMSKDNLMTFEKRNLN